MEKFYSISLHKLNQQEAVMNLKGTFLVTYVWQPDPTPKDSIAF